MPLFVCPKYNVKKTHEHVPINLLIGSAKLAIWLTCKNKARGAGCFEPVLVLKGLLRVRLKIEYVFFYSMIDNVMLFSTVWTVEGELCSVGEDGGLC